MLKHLQISFAWVAMIGIAAGPIPLLAQTGPAPVPTGEQAPPAAPLLSPDQLDTLLAPIALYPDPLLAQIMPAATMPTEVVMAYRYVKSGKSPDQIDAQQWDESVKALARYPDVLKMMDKDLDWTTALGDAFVAQPNDVFNSVQRLRAKAESFGNLKSTPQQVVSTDQNIIQIMPADPQVIYVPQYQPQVVYVQAPPDPLVPLITFGAGLALGIWIHNSVNWYGGNVYYNNNGWNNHYHGGGWNNNYHGGGNNVTINNNNNININNGNGNVWKPKPGYKPGGGGNNGNWPNNGTKPGTRPGGNGGGQQNPFKPGYNGGGNKPSTLPGSNGSGQAPKPGNRPGGNGGGQAPKPENRPGGNGGGQAPKPGGGFGGNGSGQAPKPENNPFKPGSNGSGQAPKPSNKPGSNGGGQAPKPGGWPGSNGGGQAPKPSGGFGGNGSGQKPANNQMTPPPRRKRRIQS